MVRRLRQGGLCFVSLCALVFLGCSGDVGTIGQEPGVTQAVDVTGGVDSSGGVEDAEAPPEVDALEMGVDNDAPAERQLDGDALHQDAPVEGDAARTGPFSDTSAPGPDVEVEAGCANDECEIDAECVPNLDGHPENPCLACIVVASRDSWSARDEEPCDDGLACTEDDLCWDGTCVGSPVQCPDDGPCVASECAEPEGACVSSPVEGTCDDADACTLDDACNAGVCSGLTPRECDDGNPCTVDSCDPVLGCRWESNEGAPCDDGSICTLGDTCAAGVCSSGEAVKCDDGDVCTIGTCDAVEGCSYESIAHLCVDENPCTDALCDKDAGCVFPPNQEACDDGSVCTVSDVCSEGVCSGLPLDLDDGNPCTDDFCDSVLGPIHQPNQLTCDDADACTLGDQCSEGRCVPGSGAPVCDDSNLCTDDLCDALEGCITTPNTKACDDESLCTTGDVCSGGECVRAEIVCDDNPCTSDACVDDEGCVNTLILSNACRPVITVAYPPRGATLVNTAFVDVTGEVTSGAGDIVELTVNGEPADTLGPSFSASISPVFGGNTLVIEATDSLGTTRKHVQAFHWAPSYLAPDAKAQPGIGIWMAQETIDDGDHSLPPDDLATIFELIFAGYPLNGLVDGKVAETSILGADYDVNVSNFSAGPRSVSLDALDGKLGMTAVIDDIYADVDLVTGAWFAPNYPGYVTIEEVVVTGDVSIEVQGHQLVASLESISVQIVNEDFNFDSGVVNFLLGWLADIFIGGLIGELEQTFEGEFASQLEPLLADALGTLAFSTSFDMPSLDPNGESISVALTTDFEDVAVNPSGAEFQLRASATSVDANSYDNLGAVERSACGGGEQVMDLPMAGPFEIGFSDDTFNLLLYAAWQGGLLEFTVPPEMLADVDLGQFGLSPDALNIEMSGMLAPVVSDCANGDLVLHVGDLKVLATMDLFGQSLDVEMYASFSAGVSLSVADGVLGIAIEEIESLESQISIVQEDLVASEVAIAALIDENLVPALLGALGGGALGGFPLPEIALSDDMLDLPPGSIPEGTAIGINPQSSTHDAGNVFISGTLK